MGLPVPHGFVVTTDTCTDYFKTTDSGLLNKLPDHFVEEYVAAVHQLERHTGKTFGCIQPGETSHNPLLLSVRSGAAVPMPGKIIVHPFKPIKELKFIPCSWHVSRYRPLMK